MALNQGMVFTPVTANNGDGSFPNQVFGKQAEAIVAELRGKYAVAASRGNVFTTSTAAGATIPTTGATLASKWCLLNPAGSGKYLELIRMDICVATATEVVNVLGLTKSTSVAAGLGTLTAGVINNTAIGAGAAGTSVANYYTAATHVDTPVWFKSLMSINATAVGKFIDSYLFDGAFQLWPGNCIDLVVSTGAQASTWADAVWAEWPVF